VNVNVEGGVVTLTGMVRSDAVSQAIQGKAESLLIQETPSEQINSLGGDVKNELVVAER